MSNELFKSLKSGIVDLLSSQGINDTNPPPPQGEKESYLLDGMDILAISIDEVAVMLSYCEAVQADRTFLFCEFGAIPPELELAVMRRLMELNFLLYRGNSPSFTRDPDSGRIMLMGEIPLSEATPENVIAYMRSTTSQALNWRKTFFLPEDESVVPNLRALA